jgi:hypothetical protein
MKKKKYQQMPESQIYNMEFWINDFKQCQIKNATNKAKRDAKNKEKKGRGKILQSDDFPNKPKGAIITPNFQYFLEIFQDLYMCNSISLLSSMSFEDALRFVKNEAMKHSWKDKSNTCPLIQEQVILKQEYNLLMLKYIQYEDKPEFVEVLSKFLQRSYVIFDILHLYIFISYKHTYK